MNDLDMLSAFGSLSPSLSSGQGALQQYGAPNQGFGGGMGGFAGMPTGGFASLLARLFGGGGQPSAAPTGALPPMGAPTGMLPPGAAPGGPSGALPPMGGAVSPSGAFGPSGAVGSPGGVLPPMGAAAGPAGPMGAPTGVPAGPPVGAPTGAPAGAPTNILPPVQQAAQAQATPAAAPKPNYNAVIQQGLNMMSPQLPPVQPLQLNMAQPAGMRPYGMLHGGY